MRLAWAVAQVAILLGWPGVMGCTRSIDDPRALACAEVVARHLRLQEGVVVTEAAENAAGDGFEIAYEAKGGEGLPVEGSADCSFEPGSTRVIAARVGDRLVLPTALP